MLGVASVLPLVWLTTVGVGLSIGYVQPLESTPGAVLAGVTLFTMLGELCAIAYFILRAVRDPGRTMMWKLGWVIGLSAFGVLAAPGYWFVHLRKVSEEHD